MKDESPQRRRDAEIAFLRVSASGWHVPEPPAKGVERRRRAWIGWHFYHALRSHSGRATQPFGEKLAGLGGGTLRLGGTSLSLRRRAWSVAGEHGSGGTSTTPFARTQGVPPNRLAKN